MNTKDPEMTPNEALSFILHQDNLMWSRLQTMQAVQLAGLAAAYALRCQASLSVAIVSLTALLTLLAFCLLRRDFVIQERILDRFPQFEWSASRRVHAPLKGREGAWAILALLLAADVYLGIAAGLKWL
jgi:hypothetical protein